MLKQVEKPWHACLLGNRKQLFEASGGEAKQTSGVLAIH